MPYLKFYTPELSVSKKRRIAKELTRATMRSFQLSPEDRDRCTVHFVPFRMEDMAIGGKLMIDAPDPDYLLEVTDRQLTAEKKKTFVETVTPLLIRLLEMERKSWIARLLVRSAVAWKINIQFIEYKPEDSAIGGKFLSELEQDAA